MNRKGGVIFDLLMGAIFIFFAGHLFIWKVEPEVTQMLKHEKCFPAYGSMAERCIQVVAK